MSVHVFSYTWLFVTPCTVANLAPPNPWGFSFKSTVVGCHFQLQDLPDRIKHCISNIGRWIFFATVATRRFCTATCMHKIRRISVNNSNGFPKHIGIIFSRYWHSMVKMCMRELIHFHKAVLATVQKTINISIRLETEDCA